MSEYTSESVKAANEIWTRMQNKITDAQRSATPIIGIPKSTFNHELNRFNIKHRGENIELILVPRPDFCWEVWIEHQRGVMFKVFSGTERNQAGYGEAMRTVRSIVTDFGLLRSVGEDEDEKKPTKLYEWHGLLMIVGMSCLIYAAIKGFSWAGEMLWHFLPTLWYRQ